MGHYKEIADFYSFIQDFYKGTITENSDPSTEVKVSYLLKKGQGGPTTNKIETLITRLMKLLSDGNFKMENIPPDLKETMKEFGWKEKQGGLVKVTKKPCLVDIRNHISESDPPKLVVLYPNGIKEVTFANYEEMLTMQSLLEEKIERFKGRIQRYKNNPVVFAIEQAAIKH
jgi:hypothetical protein